MSESVIYYEVIEDEYVFYYGREILFKNSKNNPFLYITMENEGVKKQLPLHYCDITKKGTSGYKIKFFNKSCAVFFEIEKVEETVVFKFIRSGLLGEKLKINLYKKNAKINGLGLNPYGDLNNKKVTFKNFINAKNYVDITPEFSVKSSYYFNNGNLGDWEISFFGSVKVTTAQNSGEFYLIFDKNKKIEDKKESVLKIIRKKKITKNKIGYTGFIADYKDRKDYRKYIEKIRKSGYEYYLRFSPVVNKKDEDFDKYDKEDLIEISDGNYIINKENENNKRLLTNKIRKYLDLNIDGLYVDEIGIKNKKFDNEKNLFIYKYLHETIYSVSQEYPSKIHIYNKLNPALKKIGIYSVNYSKIKDRYREYHKSLVYSGVESVYYECTKSEAKILKQYDKKQLIIK